MTSGLTTVQGSAEKVEAIMQVCAIYLLLYIWLPGKKQMLIKAGLWEANQTANKSEKVLRYWGRQSSHRWYQNTFLNMVNKFIFCPGIGCSLQLPQSYFDINRIIEKDHPSVENVLKTFLCFYDNILMKTQMQKKSDSIRSLRPPFLLEKSCSQHEKNMVYFCGQWYMKNWRVGAVDVKNTHDWLKSKVKW